jgi:hypothetical protein
MAGEISRFKKDDHVPAKQQLGQNSRRKNRFRLPDAWSLSNNGVCTINGY